MSDRIVHADYPGMEIVRYDRAGKWYFEPTDPRLPRQHVGVKAAALRAKWALENGGQVHLGQSGGAVFDRLVSA